MNFEDYLTSKKIDAKAFATGDAEVFLSWKTEFEQMHPNSFTVQKLNLINPIRRKYQLKGDPAMATTTSFPEDLPKAAAPKIAKPVFKPKPKID